MNANQKGKAGNKTGRISYGERHRIRQLLACLLLFGFVAAGRGMHWEPVEQIVKTMGRFVGADTDYQEVFSSLGESVSKRESFTETIHKLIPVLFLDEGNDGEKHRFFRGNRP